MGRLRRNSPILEKASTRAANLRAISPTLDLGSGLTLAEFEQSIAEFRTLQDEYNGILALADEKKNILEAKAKALKERHTRMLAGVGVRWGKNSNEYEKAGGTRTDERKKSGGGSSNNNPPES